VAVAAQYTLPVPSLVQLGSELAAPAKLFHAPHFFPLNSLTMMTDLPHRTAHATCPVETGAQDGLPIPVALPVEMKPPQVADAAGAISRQADNDNRRVAIFFNCVLAQVVGFMSVVTDGSGNKNSSQVYHLVSRHCTLLVDLSLRGFHTRFAERFCFMRSQLRGCPDCNPVSEQHRENSSVL